MNELEINLQNILNDKNKNLLPENLKEGVTCLGIKGILSSSLGDIKLFSTIEDMNNDPNAQNEDLAVVYGKSTTNMKADSSTQYITFPKTVTLPEKITSSYYCRLGSTDMSQGWFDGNISLSSSSFSFDGFGNDMVRVYYTSTDGINYTRNDISGNVTDDTVNFNLFLSVETASEWNDNFGYFMQIEGYDFNGIYKNTHITTYGTVLSNQGNELLLPSDRVYSDSNLTSGSYTSQPFNTGALIKVIEKDDQNRILKGVWYDNMNYSGLYLNADNYNIYNTPNAYIQAIPIEVDWNNVAIYKSGEEEDINNASNTPVSYSIDLTPFDEFIFSEPVKIYSDIDKTEILETGNNIELPFSKYTPAPNQLTATNSDILTDVIAYGSNNIITGDDSIYIANRSKLLAGISKANNDLYLNSQISRYYNCYSDEGLGGTPHYLQKVDSFNNSIETTTTKVDIIEPGGSSLTSTSYTINTKHYIVIATRNTSNTVFNVYNKDDYTLLKTTTLEGIYYFHYYCKNAKNFTNGDSVDYIIGYVGSNDPTSFAILVVKNDGTITSSIIELPAVNSSTMYGTYSFGAYFDGTVGYYICDRSIKNNSSATLQLYKLDSNMTSTFITNFNFASTFVNSEFFITYDNDYVYINCLPKGASAGTKSAIIAIDKAIDSFKLAVDPASSTDKIWSILCANEDTCYYMDTINRKLYELHGSDTTFVTNVQAISNINDGINFSGNYNVCYYISLNGSYNYIIDFSSSYITALEIDSGKLIDLFAYNKLNNIQGSYSYPSVQSICYVISDLTEYSKVVFYGVAEDSEIGTCLYKICYDLLTIVTFSNEKDSYYLLPYTTNTYVAIKKE